MSIFQKKGKLEVSAESEDDDEEDEVTILFHQKPLHMSMATGNAVEITTDILLLHDYFRNQNALVFVHLILKVKRSS